MKKVLRKIKRFCDKLFGTEIDSAYWRFRHFFDRSWAEGYLAEESISHPHRKILIDIISRHYPFESILEFGCASGPNLYLFSKKYENVKIFGVDISKDAVETGKKFFKTKNIKNISFNAASNLSAFSDKSIDVVFSDAVLIYFGPDKITAILKDMIRVAKKTIALLEMNTTAGSHLYEDNWIYNYKQLVGKIAPSANVLISKLPAGVWGGNWEKYGSIIEIKL